MRRRAKPASEKEIADANVSVEVTLELGLDVIKQVQALAGSDDPKAIKKVIERMIRESAELESEKTTVESRILSDKKFIAALARKVKKAA